MGIIDKLRNYLNKDIGIIMNVDNSEIRNEGGYITIKIPLKSFLKYGSDIINESNTTRHVVLGKDDDGTINPNKNITMEGKSTLNINQNKDGFTLEDFYHI
jgi:hypothetical protein